VHSVRARVLLSFYEFTNSVCLCEWILFSGRKDQLHPMHRRSPPYPYPRDIYPNKHALVFSPISINLTPVIIHDPDPTKTTPNSNLAVTKLCSYRLPNVSHPSPL